MPKVIMAKDSMAKVIMAKIFRPNGEFIFFSILSIFEFAILTIRHLVQQSLGFIKFSFLVSVRVRLAILDHFSNSILSIFFFIIINKSNN